MSDVYRRTHAARAKVASRTSQADLRTGIERAAFFLGVLIFILSVMAVRMMMSATS